MLMIGINTKWDVSPIPMMPNISAALAIIQSSLFSSLAIEKMSIIFIDGIFIFVESRDEHWVILLIAGLS
jgi:hypothetical protein